MLPFLDKRKMTAGLMISQRKPDEGAEPSSNEMEALEVAAKDILQAIKMDDHKKLATAIKAAYDILESQEDQEDMPESDNEELE